MIHFNNKTHMVLSYMNFYFDWLKVLCGITVALKKKVKP